MSTYEPNYPALYVESVERHIEFIETVLRHAAGGDYDALLEFVGDHMNGLDVYTDELNGLWLKAKAHLKQEASE